MPSNQVNSEIREFILNKFPLARKQTFKDSDALLETGILDSLGVLDVVSFLEEKFSIAVADDDLVPENFHSIDKLSDFVQRKSGKVQ
jgi:acyl carrier protein